MLEIHVSGKSVIWFNNTAGSLNTQPVCACCSRGYFITFSCKQKKRFNVNEEDELPSPPKKNKIINNAGDEHST